MVDVQSAPAFPPTPRQAAVDALRAVRKSWSIRTCEEIRDVVLDAAGYEKVQDEKRVTESQLRLAVQRAETLERDRDSARQIVQAGERERYLLLGRLGKARETILLLTGRLGLDAEVTGALLDLDPMVTYEGL